MLVPRTPRSPLQRLKQPLLMTLLSGRVQLHRRLRGRGSDAQTVGSSTLISADAPTGGELWSTDVEVEYLAVSLPVATCQALLPDLPSWAQPRATPERFTDPKVAHWVGELYGHHLRGEPLGSLYTEALSNVLLTYLAASYGDARPPASPASARRLRAGVVHVREHIDANLADPLTLAELAEQAGCSVAHLNRLFNAAYGRSVHRYVLEQRVALARGLLAQPGLCLAEVALACGFASQSHLTSAFKAALGTTPGAWRRQVS
jgi:AraC family transcriptional regulator